MKDILPGGLGGLIFGVLYLALNVPLAFALGGAVGGYVAGRFFVSRSRGDDGGIIFAEDAEAAASVISGGEKQVKVLKELADTVVKPEVRAKCQGLAALAEKIMTNLKENPKDVKRARQFLNYYLNATCTILQRYTELASRNIKSPEVGQTLTKVEGILDSIQHAFEQQLVAAAQDEILDLDTEMKLLEQTLQLENLNSAK
jgi:hypothetical protein